VKRKGLIRIGVAAVLALGMGGAWAQADAGASAVPPVVSAAEAAQLPPDQQVSWLRSAAASGALEHMDDTQLVTLFQSLDPGTLRRYIEAGPNGFGSYEFTMWRKERIDGKWPDKADHMQVRIGRDPLRVYAKWLPDGAHAGQEVLYDESKRSGEMYGHLGGILGMVSIWSAVDGSLAKAQSNHSVRELGTEYTAKLFLAQGSRFAQAGIVRPAKIDVRTLDGVRVVAFTFEAPAGGTGFYAHQVTLGLDLRHPWFRSVEARGDDGAELEQIVIERIEPRTFDSATFDPKNPEYRF
jgi:hypothetical protein